MPALLISAVPLHRQSGERPVPQESVPHHGSPRPSTKNKSHNKARCQIGWFLALQILHLQKLAFAKASKMLLTFKDALAAKHQAGLTIWL
jgi:hypothetical protein